MKSYGDWVKELYVGTQYFSNLDIEDLEKFVREVQTDAFNEGFRQSHRMLGRECVEEPISSLLKKPQSK